MPLYDYRCGACGAEQEIRQKMTDDPETVCPICGKPALERLVSQSSFSLKGSGWYADGYGGGAERAKSDGGTNSTEKKETKGDSTPKSDEKKPAKTEAKSSPSAD